MGDWKFYYAKYGHNNWTEFAPGDWVCVNQIMGLWALKKEALAMLEGLGCNICIKTTAPEGRITYAPLISARELNEPVQALQALDTCAMPIINVETAVAQFAYYGLLSYPCTGWLAKGLDFTPDRIIAEIDALEGWQGLKHFAGPDWMDMGSGMARAGNVTANMESPHIYGAPINWEDTSGTLGPADYPLGLGLASYGQHIEVYSGTGYSPQYISGMLSLFYMSILSTASISIDLLFSALMRQLPDGCVIDDAWADLTVSAERIVVAEDTRWFMTGAVDHVLDPTNQYCLFTGVGVIGLDYPSPETYEVLFDTATDPPGNVNVVGVRLGANNSISSIGVSASVPADGQPHRTQIRELVREWYSQRNNGGNIGLMPTPNDTGIMPQVSVVDEWQIPWYEGQTQNEWQNAAKFHKLKWKTLLVDDGRVGITNAVVKFSLNGVASTIMCGGGVPFPLPAMG